MTKYFDFDAFVAEQVEDVMTIKVQGVEEHLPASPPADLVLSVMAMAGATDKGTTVGAEQIHKMCVGLFTQERLDKWTANGMSWSQLEMLMKHVMEMYYGPQKEHAKKQEEKQVAKTPRKSSK